MFVATASIETEKASVYLVQLCKHFAHKVQTVYDEREGRVDFQIGICVMRVRGDALTLRCEAPTRADLDRLTTVVADHLVRFAWREQPKRIEWGEPDAQENREISNEPSDSVPRAGI